MDDFKLEGGELFKENFRKLLKQELIYLRKQLIQKFSSPKQQAKAAVPEKQSVLVPGETGTHLAARCPVNLPE